MPSDVPAQVFEEFLTELASEGLPQDLIVRLRKTLLVEKSFNDRALRTAIVSEEPPS
jgi:hypothetical protein